MSNLILRQGVVTPFVQFNFAHGSIESSINNPKYFMSLSHNRTCKQACSFKLNIVYVPDTFSPGEPTLIDNFILSSINQKVTYFYGYYDCWGNRHVQQQTYSGQVYTYNSDIDIASGTINYTVEGTAVAVDLSNSLATIEEVDHTKKPSIHLRYLTSGATTGGFTDLKNFYEIYTGDNSDKEVHIPYLGSGPVLDLIMGKVIEGSFKNDGLPVRRGGLAQLAHAASSESVEDAYRLGLVSGDTYSEWQNLNTYLNSFGGGDKSHEAARRKEIEQSIEIPFIAFIDDVAIGDSKLGTLYFVKNRGWSTNNVYFYEFGNDCKESDVLSFNVNYNGAKAVAAAPATQNVISAIDADGNAIGHTEATTKVPNLSRNTFPTKSGFEENAFIAKHELADIMLYPFEATMTIVGQTIPNQLLDIIYIVVKLNGTEHPVLTGAYKILEINDSVDSSGFTTEFKLIRQAEDNSGVTDKLENFVQTPNNGDAQKVQDAIDNKLPNSDSNNGKVANR